MYSRHGCHVYFILDWTGLYSMELYCTVQYGTVKYCSVVMYSTSCRLESEKLDLFLSRFQGLPPLGLQKGQVARDKFMNIPYAEPTSFACREGASYLRLYSTVQNSTVLTSEFESTLTCKRQSCSSCSSSRI